ncbi:hypothetical protein HNQ91_001104 [Filimonas zeae]|uniref:Uncharacterized protein n=1 Tax=Filimonas zeae TaxID=1737353 RepID=A0A917MSH7_9BACT|nr:hypothetical protein [Filimonas zeae]MDR6338082.1 hypothetical protein [Filimonas zeae]GGH61623.1 hypothetical protein GCM10011379_10790 [Filimonas zeae]
MKLQLDVKSVIAGAVAAAVIVAAFSFRDTGTADTAARYQTKVSGSEVVILDTYTGKYIIAPEIRNFGKVQWVKGSFTDTWATGLDNKKAVTADEAK